MKYDPEIHYRRSIRLKGYDYSREGAYFVTVCLKDREHLLGKVVNKKMIENLPGKLIRKIWLEIPNHYPGFKTDYFVVMPNHIHGIIIKENVGAGPCACPDSQINNKGAATGSRPYNLSLSDIIERFKSLTTSKYIEGIDIFDWKPFNGKLWQRGFYDRIIRNEKELDFYCYYIKTNPSKWTEDEYFIEG